MDNGKRNSLKLMLGVGAMASTAGILTFPGSAHAQAPKRGGRVRAATSSSSTADTLDPAKGANGTDYTRQYMLYSGLTQLDASLAPQPALAEEIRNDKATTWTFKLRKGVKFHDGSPLTPADVVYSLNRHKDAATASKVKTVAEQFAEVKASGPNEVQVKLSGPNADLPVILAASHFLIVKDGTRDFATANGTGPFKLKEFKPGVRSVAVRNDGYWKPGQPYLDEVELIGIPELNLEGDSMSEIAYDAVKQTIDSLPRARRRDPDELAESVRRAVRNTLAGHWGKKPMCHVHVLTV